MNSITKAISCALFCGIFCSSLSASPVLQSYTLTKEEKAQFLTTSGTPSAFWTTDWAGRDSIAMDPVNNAYPNSGDPWSGPNDSRLTVKAAADNAGLYLYFLIEDDKFLDPVDNRWDYDATDFDIDERCSAQIRAGGKDSSSTVHGEYPFAMDATGQQFQAWAGTSTVIGWNTFHWDGVVYGTANIADLASQHNGMAVKTSRIDSTHRAHEWFIPWEVISNGGDLKTGDSLAGRQFAFAGGYNDLDYPNGIYGNATAIGSAVKRLRWNLYDPFLKDWTKSLSSWGDIQMAADMPAVHGTTSIKIQKSGHSIMQDSRVLKDELYNLQGKKIPTGLRNAGNSLIIQRTLLTDGKTVSRWILCK